MNTRPAAILMPSGEQGSAAGVGGAMGFCSGRFCRSVSDASSVMAGGAFIFLTALVKFNYITINYKKVERDILTLLDLNKDGKVDMSDYQFISARLADSLVNNQAPMFGGFGAGFAVGFKSVV
eukprot:CAMPEP_0119308644 /NCGR_PEP_ID=MMETSP1333-20130426/11687_1 /TAXON_ID=418940 /ORGANISM="Scyphosphaera apsteinii, Strain RCC1455" /LENGTH=122 /DNA_ID=CAMNT_0007312461 /DNA_START=90 /DNA_END=458 /DNA_ORIENTATION=-